MEGNRYQMTTKYEDETKYTFYGDNLARCLSAIAIYMEDPSLVAAAINDLDTGEAILDWTRDE
jgi:hypothetical protein